MWLPGLLAPAATGPALRGLPRNGGSVRRLAAPRRGSAVDSYKKVAVLCSTCGELLALYRKRNGTKSSLVKMYLERVAEDPHDILGFEGRIPACGENQELACPSCHRSFCRGPRLVKGRPAWKMISGRVRMK
mmetsp:Transcript_32145/g.66233  ORF Transcript_32145/g.66233 Transcript_32145/m.66233 type:complete len:132 (-) Transcript_32145:46-441(-)